MKFPEADHNPSADFRQRMGSIVRKSLGSVSSSGSKETLIGSTGQHCYRETIKKCSVLNQLEICLSL